MQPDFSFLSKYAGANFAPKKKAPIRGRGGPLTAWISEGAGTGGALAGAAAGAAAGAPFAGVGAIPGAIIGGIAGGFLGGTGGRLVENKIRDDRNPWGAGSEGSLGQALGEGAISGVFGGIGPAFQGARGLSALSKASGGIGGLKGIGAGAKVIGAVGDDATRAALGKAIVKGGAKAGKGIGQLGVGALDDIGKLTQGGLSSAGDTLRASQRGIIPGNNGLSPRDAKAYNAALDSANKWFSGIGKGGQYTNADEAISALTKSYKAAPEAAKAFGKSNADELTTRFLQNIDDNPALRGTLKGKNGQIVKNLLDDVAKLKGQKNSDFVGYMSSKINPRYRTISSGGSAGSVESQILEAFRDAGKGIIDEKLVTRSGVNKQLSALMGASKELSKTITRDTGAGAGQGLTLGRLAADVMGPTADVVGRGFQQVGKVTNGPLGGLAGGAIKRGLANSMSAAPAPEAPFPEGAMGFEGEGEGGYSGMSGMGMQPGMAGAAPVQSRYSLDQAISDYQANAGNPKVQQQIMEYYNFIQKAEQAQTGGGGSAAERKTQKQAQTAMQGLSQLKSLYSSAGGGQNRLPGVLSSVQGLLGNNSKAESYNKIRDSLTTALARAFGETGVLTDQDREVYKQALPRLEDTPEEAAIKLQYLEDMLAESSAGGYAETESQNPYSLKGAF